MTKQAAFTPEEWETILEAPTSAGMIVVTASRGVEVSDAERAAIEKIQAALTG